VAPAISTVSRCRAGVSTTRTLWLSRKSGVEAALFYFFSLSRNFHQHCPHLTQDSVQGPSLQFTLYSLPPSPGATDSQRVPSSGFRLREVPPAQPLPTQVETCSQRAGPWKAGTQCPRTQRPSRLALRAARPERIRSRDFMNFVTPFPSSNATSGSSPKMHGKASSLLSYTSFLRLCLWMALSGLGRHLMASGEATGRVSRHWSTTLIEPTRRPNLEATCAREP
jgi:hypothetical protein